MSIYRLPISVLSLELHSGRKWRKKNRKYEHRLAEQSLSQPLPRNNASIYYSCLLSRRTVRANLMHTVISFAKNSCHTSPAKFLIAKLRRNVINVRITCRCHVIFMRRWTLRPFFLILLIRVWMVLILWLGKLKWIWGVLIIRVRNIG